ncbi:serine/threonine-protein kinase [Sorangium sp. Soce836]|uniref:serine/threonine-protein kinase n=1 Tax=Sorangium sp. So ce836 TaxID=2969250 RepID=UPI002350F456|nr:serine/threonine-protein kinase [Sorangium sp. Soce836]WCQ92856.1 serine-threonine kinase [Sorangium sp. Soce836]
MKPDAPASAAGIPRIGEVFAQRYRLERSLGRGSMGAVFVAEHVSLRQRVAVKFLLPRAKDFPGASARFLREARAAAAIRSEHVARVIDVGTAELGLPYIVMEHLRGRDLQQVLDARGPLPVSEAVDYVLQSCEAVAEAHARGIVHRDLKPGNLFLTSGPSGVPVVKVLDFGLSKSAEDAAEEDGKLTASEMMLGSPCYMSPEQVRCTKDVDARTDVWALGIILYQLLTARFPFDAPSVSALFVAIVTDAPRPPRVHRWELPVHLEEVILRCLEKDVQQRLQSVVELSRALAPYGTEHSARALDQIEAIAAGKAFPSLPPPPPDPAASTTPAGAARFQGATVTWPRPGADDEPDGRFSRRATVVAPGGGDPVTTLPSPGTAADALRTRDAAPAERTSVPVSSDEGPTLMMAREDGPTLTMAREDGPTLTMAREDGPTLTMAHDDGPTLPWPYRLLAARPLANGEESIGSVPVVTERRPGQQSSLMLRKRRRAAARIAAAASLTAAVAVGVTLWSRRPESSSNVGLPSGPASQAPAHASSLDAAGEPEAPASVGEALEGAAGTAAPAQPPGSAAAGGAGPGAAPSSAASGPKAPLDPRLDGALRKPAHPPARPPGSAARDPRAPALHDPAPAIRDDR